jgi:hypothetical protein
MSVDVDIYMNNILSFFRQNPKELLSLVPKEKEKEFYSKIREEAMKNNEKGEDVELTQKQLINICRELNTNNTKYTLGVSQDIVNKVLIKTPFGEYSLN